MALQLPYLLRFRVRIKASFCWLFFSEQAMIVKPRNPLVVPALKKKAGKHGKTFKAQRKLDNQRVHEYDTKTD